MKLFNLLKTHKMSILSVLLVAAAAVLGADGSFAMAVEPMEPAPAPNPAGEGPRGNEPGGMENRPADEQPKADLAGLETVMRNKVATATDVRDAGVEADDYDKDVVNYNKWKYASDTILMTRVKPIRVSSMYVQHFEVAPPNLDTNYSGSGVSISANAKSVTIPLADFDNPDCLATCTTVIIPDVDGYVKDASSTEISDGALQLVVLDPKNNAGQVEFHVVNGSSTQSITIPTGVKFLTAAPAGLESQMEVDPITYLPVSRGVNLQKKLGSTIINDAFREQIKKTPLSVGDVIKYVTDVFKRLCVRSAWLGAEGRWDGKSKKGNREAGYMQKGILRQITSYYNIPGDLTLDDLMAMSSMMFTEWAQSDKATVFCGKEAIASLMKLVNSTATQYKDIAKVEVNELGVTVRKYKDNFGEFEFVYEQLFDEIGLSSCFVALDLASMVRYYMRDDKIQTLDLKKSGDMLEAEAWNISRIDCYCLKGNNALMAAPASFGEKANKFITVKAKFTKTSGSESALSDLTTTVKYYLTKDLGGFKANTIIEYDPDFKAWKAYEGRIFA